MLRIPVGERGRGEKFGAAAIEIFLLAGEPPSQSQVQYSREARPRFVEQPAADQHAFDRLGVELPFGFAQQAGLKPRAERVGGDSLAQLRFTASREEQARVCERVL